MNTAPLKIFATAARNKLLAQVSAQLDRVRLDDGAYQREHARAIQKLEERIHAVGKAAVIDEVAYTWFNRLVALRYMDVNDYAPVRAVSPRDAAGLLPELLQEAKRGLIADDLSVNRQRVFDLLDGKLPSPDGQNEAYRLLLVADCNRRATQLPFLFQRIDDYTELLLPPDLLSKQSILYDLRAGMPAEVCTGNEEVIGWLYQFYIIEKKAEVDKAKKKRKVRPDEIPAVTQLFTPRWIVEYMVQNTLGKLWLESHPESRLRDFMEYYIESDDLPLSPPNPQGGREGATPQDLTLADQACGSGHILLYAFELLTHIYEEVGYSKSAIPGLILEHNLTGFEIDERAAQLAGFSLMMRARRYHRRALGKELCPRIIRFEPLTLSEERITTIFKSSDELTADLNDMRQVANLGSLIVPRSSPLELSRARTQVQSQLEGADLFEQRELRELEVVLEQLQELQRKFMAVVDNPPYLGSSNFNAPLKKYVNKHYSLSKSDLMATFMERGLAALEEGGYLGMINQHSWMFLSSYEKLRKHLIETVHFDTMLHLGPRAFPEIGGEVVQSTAFTFRNNKPKDVTENHSDSRLTPPLGAGGPKPTIADRLGTYLRLVNFGTDEKAPKTRAAIQNPALNYFYRARQEDFAKIPGWPVGYWLPLAAVSNFEVDALGSVLETREGMITAGNDRFLRLWWENDTRRIASEFNVNGKVTSIGSNARWFFYNKGGDFRRWNGNIYFTVDWENDGNRIRNNFDEKTGRLRSHNYNGSFGLKEGLTWTYISSSKFAVRYSPIGRLFDGKGAMGFSDENLKFAIGLLNTNVAQYYLSILAPTIDYKVGDIPQVPYIVTEADAIERCSDLAINISLHDWNRYELAIDFTQNPLLNAGVRKIKVSVDRYEPSTTKDFAALHFTEEQLNEVAIKSYSLHDILLPTVPLQDITILQSELDRKALAKLNDQLKRDPTTGLVTNYDELELPFRRDEIMAQFVSYAVGCMMGRYSLDKEGLILANAGDGLMEYTERVGKPASEWTFAPDADGILPVLAGDFFEDDIVGRFRAFLLAAFGEEHFSENLTFVEECLESKEGKSVAIRKYFTRDFYKDHVQRYKKRPIYWLFSSPGKHFQALVYLHRYTPDTVNLLLNDYLRPYVDKLEARKSAAERLQDDAASSARAKTDAARTIKDCTAALADCRAYERDTLYPLALRRLPLDLDDGVLVNYNKLGDAVLTVGGLNDKSKRKQVEAFEWVDFAWGA